MEKKNTILLTVVAIATLLVTIIGATFAYFASNIQVNNTLNVNVATSNNQAVFTAISSGNLELNIASYMMQEHDATTNSENGTTTNNSDITSSLTNTANIEVTLNANGTGGEVECKYDVLYSWDNSSSTFENYSDASSKSGDKFHPSKYYLRSEYKKSEDGSEEYNPTDNFREITLSGTMTHNPNTSESGSSTNIFNEGEKNIDEFNCATESSNGECQTIILKDDETIATSTEASTKYEFIIKFYNLPTDQTSLMNKNFKGKIYIGNVSC